MIVFLPLIRIVRNFYKFPMPAFMANAIDNPLRRRIQPPTEAPIRHARARARLVYPDLEWNGEERWLGHRPSTVDSLPFIGPSPKAPRIHFAFGAQHIGLTSGPKTGRLIAGLIGVLLAAWWKWTEN